MIRVQSNNMPNKCYQQNAYTNFIPDYQTVDFYVDWNPEAIETRYEKDFDTDWDTDSLLCDIDRTHPRNLPEGTLFWKSGLTPKFSRVVGFSKFNTLLFNGLIEYGEDKLTKDAVQGSQAYKYDKCLTTTDDRNSVMHTHTITPCAHPDGGSDLFKPGNC
jgi:hypothetical protein